MDAKHAPRPIPSFFIALAACVAGVAASIVLGLLALLLLPDSFFVIVYGGGAQWAGYGRIIASSAVIAGASGLVAGGLSPARWSGVVLGVGWCCADIVRNRRSESAWDNFEVLLLVVCLLAPPLAHAFTVARTRRQLRRRREAEAQLQGLAQ